jgi:hypothetical protein
MNLFDIRHYKISRAACHGTDRIAAEKHDSGGKAMGAPSNRARGFVAAAESAGQLPPLNFAHRALLEFV